MQATKKTLYNIHLITNTTTSTAAPASDRADISSSGHSDTFQFQFDQGRQTRAEWIDWKCPTLPNKLGERRRENKRKYASMLHSSELTDSSEDDILYSLPDIFSALFPQNLEIKLDTKLQSGPFSPSERKPLTRPHSMMDEWAW